MTLGTGDYVPDKFRLGYMSKAAKAGEIRLGKLNFCRMPMFDIVSLTNIYLPLIRISLFVGAFLCIVCREI